MESKLNSKPESENIPTEYGGYQLYKAAGKLSNKLAIVTGGDSGIGRPMAILFATEGADSFIAYLLEEEEDAQETKRRVKKYGRKCHLMSTDLKNRKNYKAVVENTVKAMDGVDILVNNAAYQMMVNDIKDLSEYVSSPTSLISLLFTRSQRYILNMYLYCIGGCRPEEMVISPQPACIVGSLLSSSGR